MTREQITSLIVDDKTIEAARKTSQEAEGFVYYKFEDWKAQNEGEN